MPMSNFELSVVVKNVVGELVPGKHQTEGMLTKAQLTDFFTANNNLLNNEVVKAALKAAAAQDEDPDDTITDLQKEIFEGQGIAGEWGVTCLGLVGDTYQDDPDFMKLFVAMVEREEEAVNEAELAPEDFEAKKEQMKQMRAQNDTLVAQMEGMSHDEQQQFLADQLTARLSQMSPAEQEATLRDLFGDQLQPQCGEACSHDHSHQHECGDACDHDHHHHHGHSHIDATANGTADAHESSEDTQTKATES